MENSAISWTDNSWNPWIGCVKVSLGCDFCYAEGQAKYRGWATWGRNTDRKMMAESNWRKPLTWNRKAAAEGVRTRVFCASLADVFEDHPQVFDARKRLWDLIAATPHLDWLILTKRPGNILRLMPHDRLWPNVRLGMSAENQFWFDVRWPQLAKAVSVIHCAGTMVSFEPLLGAIDITKALVCCPSCGFPRSDRYAYGCGACEVHPEWHAGLGWAIVGGESGYQHRPMDLAWARSLRDQCASANVPYFFKQVGGITHDAGGHLLDGVEHYQIPTE